MDLKRLRYFLKVAEAQSMSDAAYAAHISQPALSRQIRLLEDELGVSLFERHARGITLTEAGRLLRHEAVSLVRQADRVRETLSQQAQVPRGVFSVGAPTSLRRFLVAPAVAVLHRAYPELTFKLREGTSRAMRDMLLRGETEIAIISSLEELSALDAEFLLSEGLFAVGRRGAFDRREAIALKNLAQLPLALTAAPNSLRVTVDKALARRNLHARVVAEIESFEMALELILEAGVFSVFPFCALKDVVRTDTVEVRQVEALRITWVTCTVRGRPRGAGVSAFLDAVTNHAKDLVARQEWPSALLVA